MMHGTRLVPRPGRRRRPALLALSLLVSGLLTLPLAAQPAAPEIRRQVVAGGGGAMSGGDFSLVGTSGQADAGSALSGGGFALSGGFWPGLVRPAGGPTWTATVTPGTPTPVRTASATATSLVTPGVSATPSVTPSTPPSPSATPDGRTATPSLTPPMPAPLLLPRLIVDRPPAPAPRP